MSEERTEASVKKALINSALALVFIALTVLVVIWLQHRDSESLAPVEEEIHVPAIRSESIVVPAFEFTDVTEDAGIGFSHENGAYGERLLPETMGGGVAFLDFNNDGWDDLLFINSSTWPWREDEASDDASRLYLNTRDGRFRDITEQALDLRLYGMGVAVADFDADGWLDIFVTAVGSNRLLRNVEGKTFQDVSASYGVLGNETDWSTCAVFFDFDNDSDLDLFVCNYVEWSPEIDREVDYRLTGVGRAYGPPTDFPGSFSVLYRNDGNAFTDVSAESGIQVVNAATGNPEGKALAAMPVDVNDDDLVDLIVANDTVRNFLFVNQGNGTFSEQGLNFGMAFDPAGMATGAMGIDAGNFANDVKLGVLIGNFANEMSSFYVRHAATESFSDDAIVTGIGADSRRALTFGVLMVDLDLDGWLDLFNVNGHVEPEINKVQSSQEYAQLPQLFWNCHGECRRQFVLVPPDQTGLNTPYVGRGLTSGDYDLDGDLDVVITNIDKRAVLLRNDQNLGHRWVKFSLESASSNRYGLGAEVTLHAAGVKQTRYVTPTRSYLSQNAYPVHFGLGSAQAIDSVIVKWPNGSISRHENLNTNQLHHLSER